jgi:N6-adenosine-specific RNA methylase IME4
MKDLFGPWPFGDLQPGSFQVILADPPWEYVMRSAKGYAKSPQAHYATMSLDAIKALPVDQLAASDALLFLWSTWPFVAMGRAQAVVEAWGFTAKTGGDWGKLTKDGGGLTMGPGYIVRSACEPWLIGTRGRPRLVSKSERNLILSPRREHSRKPPEAHRLLERLCPDAAKVELFARESRPGWSAWGLERDRFDDPQKYEQEQPASTEGTECKRNSLI